MLGAGVFSAAAHLTTAARAALQGGRNLDRISPVTRTAYNAALPATTITGRASGRVDDAAPNPSVDEVVDELPRSKANQGPYDPRAVRETLEERFGAGNITSTTVPGQPLQRVSDGDGVRVLTDVNGGRAVEFDYVNPLTEGTQTANIPYNSRGLPIFDDVTEYTTTIQRRVSSDTEKAIATRELTGCHPKWEG